MTTDRDMTGTWFGPSGTRVEVTSEGDGWRVAVYMRRNGTRPTGSDVFTDADDLAKRITKLEADGYTRQQPGMAPPPPSASDAAAKAMIGIGVGALLFLALILLLL